MASVAPISGETIAWEQRLADLLDPPDDGTTWKPFPKQKMATDLAHRADEILFGGSAGPGKTEWGMRHVIEQMEMYPGNRGVIFRRVFPSLTKSVIPRLKQILHGRAKYNANDHVFNFSNGSILEVGSLQYADTVLDYQGAEYGVIFFEEITEFLLSQWEYMLGRLRPPATMDDKVAKTMRPHAIATTNPGGSGHRWVKRRWVKPDAEDLEPLTGRPAPGQVWRPRATDDNPTPTSRVYVPATHADNPALLEKDPEYLNRLRANSNRGLRMAMEHGDWDALDAVEGALWNAEWLDLGRVSPEYYQKVVQNIRKVVAVDPSDGEEGGDAYGVAVCSRGADGVGYVEASYEWNNLSPKTLATMTLRLAERVGADVIVVEKNHGGKWMPAVMQMVDPYANIDVVWASDNKRTRAEPVAVLFEFHADTNPQVRGRIVGIQQELEDELTTTSFTSGEPSPNLLDAMVWGLSYLMLGVKSKRNSGAYNDQRLAGRR